MESPASYRQTHRSGHCWPTIPMSPVPSSAANESSAACQRARTRHCQLAQKLERKVLVHTGKLYWTGEYCEMLYGCEEIAAACR
jgi:hypothetical protein